MRRAAVALVFGLIIIGILAVASITSTGSQQFTSETVTNKALLKPITVRGDLNGVGPFNYTCGPDCQLGQAPNIAASATRTCTSGMLPYECFTFTHTIGGGGSTSSYCGPYCQFTKTHTTTHTTTSGSTSGRHAGVPAPVALVLAQFSDMHPNRTAADIGNEWNTKVVDYYEHVSHGLFAPYADVFGWVTLPNTEAYYGADCGGFLDTGAACAGYDYSWSLARDAVSFLEYYSGANFTQYQYLVVIHSGNGQESSGYPNDVWSATYWVAPQAGNSHHGMGFTMYSIIPETEAHGAVPLGVWDAEFGHQQGCAIQCWPDMFYPTEYTIAKTGRWELESIGTWNGSPAGSDPAFTLTINQYNAHWLYTGHGFAEINANAYLGVGNGTITIRVTEVERDMGNMSFLIVSNGHFYWIEARHQSSWDAGIPQNGVLIGTMAHPSTPGTCPAWESTCFFLLNATPSDPTLNHAAFQVGMTYADTYVRIAIMSYSAGVYTINIIAIGI